MAENLDFNPDEFMALTPEDRMRRCVQSAEQAQRLAVAAEPGRRHHYLAVADEWLRLAADMQRALDEATEVTQRH